MDWTECIADTLVYGSTLSTNQVTDYLILMIIITTTDYQTSVFDLVLA